MKKTYTFTRDDGTELSYRDMTFEECTRMQDHAEEVISAILIGISLEEIDFNQEEFNRFLASVLASVYGEDVRPSKKSEKVDFMLILGYMMHYFHSAYVATLEMPARIVFSLLERIPVVLGHKSPESIGEGVDRDGLKEALSGTGVIKW